MHDKKKAKAEVLLRIRAKKDFKSFVLLKWQRYEQKPFMDNWHIDYLCKLLEATLPTHSAFTAPLAESAKMAQSRTPSALNRHFFDNPQTSGKILECDKQNAVSLENSQSGATSESKGEVSLSKKILNLQAGGSQSGSICEGKSGFSSEQTRSYLKGNDEVCERRIHDLHRKDNADSKPITRLMINMPPSYGKTEIIARCFIAWALGNNPQRKFIYISYSDELCRKISNQVRDLLKSPFFAQVFGQPPAFLQDNANEFVLKSGGGLFVTTLKSAITGFHAHQILIDDPIKVSAMSSKSERNLVNQNFKESVLSRLQDNNSNITILMQRLGDEDLCGYLLNPKNFEQDIIEQWQQVSLKAINKEPKVWSIGPFSYTQEANEPLFPQRHDNAQLELLRLQMGEDEFSTQYLQEPMVSEAGYFELGFFKTIPSYECGEQYLYIFVDNAISVSESADNRAIVLIGAENTQGGIRYIVRDCLFGIWDESETLSALLSLMEENPSAKVYIESDGGGLILERLLQKELVRVNSEKKLRGQSGINNTIECYTPSRKVSKVEKIKAIKPYYNTGYLVFLHNARGLEQIKKELLGFNPAKPFRKDDCIDCIASALAHSDVIAPSSRSLSKPPQSPIQRLRERSQGTRKVAWNF